MHLEVMSLRHDKSFVLEVEGIEAGEKVPPLVFHTLVENGLTHGYAGKDSGVFILKRNEDADCIHFTLYNDGSSGSKNTGSSGLGLKYVRARLEEAYGRRWRMDSHPVEGGWLVAIAIQRERAPGSAEAGGDRPAPPAGRGSKALTVEFPGAAP
jgi:LytS/YehU family sensor histidine kinase